MSKKIKTLIVEFAPREKDSRTRKLRTYFTDLIKEKADITVIDLAKNPPELLDSQKVQAYYKRNYRGEKLTKEETTSLKKIDKFRDQLLSTDVLILSSPMYNFGYPAPMKAWIDAVMQKGYVYKTNKNGHVPLLKNLKVCSIYTAGILFDQINENNSWNGLTSVGARLFEYMGAKEVRVVQIEGVDMLEQKFIEYRTHNVAHLKLNTLAKKWYKVDKDIKCYSY